MSDETEPAETLPADAANPCPFLRALVHEGHIDANVEPLPRVAEVIAAAMRSETQSAPPHGLIHLIALIGSASSVRRLASTLRRGLRVDWLRGGPLDKLGGGSRVIDGEGRLNETEIARLDTFASDHVDEHGDLERGLSLEELDRMMDANYARPTVRRRRFDRRLMDAEWPVLHRVMAKTHGDTAYLSLAEIGDLIRHRRLPKRVSARLP